MRLKDIVVGQRVLIVELNEVGTVGAIDGADMPWPVAVQTAGRRYPCNPEELVPA